MAIQSFFLLALTICLVPGQASAQGSPETRFEIRQLTSAITLDGFSNEAAWAGIDPVPLTMYQPTFRGALTEGTEIRIAHDGEHLYVAGRFFDSEPDDIRVNSLYRDRTVGDDEFAILVDPFDDNETGLWFGTTPAGIRGDALVNADASGSFNSDWNTHWDVATQRTEDGWFAEMRIPFSSLGFQTRDGQVAMGISAYRLIARKNERQMFPAIAPEFNYLRASLARDAVITNVSTHRPVYVTPYALGGRTRNAELVQDGSRYRTDAVSDGDIGADLKYNVTANLTVDLTINTDFAQVEVDDQQVNLTRFGLFFPEKRQFFQQRSGIFDFFTGGADRLFHSRQVGLVDNEPVRLLGGARLAGRIGDWDVGVLNMQTGSSGANPSENFGVARVRRRVFNDFSTIGAMVTTRAGNDGTYNIGYGVDGTFRLAGDDYLTVRVAQTVDDALVDSLGFRAGEASLARFILNRRRSRGFTYSLSGRYQGPDYRPDLGFINRTNISEVFYSFSYFHWPEGDGPLRRIDPFQLFGNVILRNGDGTVETAFIEQDFDLQWKSGASLGLDLELHYEDLTDPLLLPNGAVVPVGSHWFPRFEGNYALASGSPFRTFFNWGLAGFFDGWRVDLGVNPRWNLSRHLEVDLRYGVNFVRFPDRNQGFDSHLVRLRTRFALDTKFSITAFAQVSNANDFAGANVRLRYNFAEGNDLWLVYDEGLNLDRFRETPVLPRSDRRAVLLKYTYTFTM